MKTPSPTWPLSGLSEYRNEVVTFFGPLLEPSNETPHNVSTRHGRGSGMAKRNSYTPEFKAKVVMELIEGDDSLSAVASRHSISPSMLSDWRRQLVDNASVVFSREQDIREQKRPEEKHGQEVDNLHRLVGKLTVERDYLQQRVKETFGVSGLE